MINIGQPESGIPVGVNSTGNGDDAIKAAQRWMLWKLQGGTSGNAAKWVFQAIGGSGGLLDYSRKCFKRAFAMQY